MDTKVCRLGFFRQCRKSDGPKFPNLLSIVRRESSKRSFNARMILGSVVNSFNPIDVLCSLAALSWYIVITSLLKPPVLLIRELRALQSRRKHYYPDTLTYTLSCYLPLTVQALREAISISRIVVTAPKIIFEVLFLKHPHSSQLQTISPCGRKVVAWSEEVDVELVRRIADVTGATETEILLTATVDVLKEYLRRSAVSVPDDVFATVKYVSQRTVFLRNHESRGILCLALPIRTPLFHDDLIEMLQVRNRRVVVRSFARTKVSFQIQIPLPRRLPKVIQRNVREIRSKQSAIYAVTAAEASCGLISSCMPSILLKLLLNQLSKKYSLCLTHIDGDLPVEGVDTAIYWRPPQGNCGKSRYTRFCLYNTPLMFFLELVTYK